MSYQALGLVGGPGQRAVRHDLDMGADVEHALDLCRDGIGGRPAGRLDLEPDALEHPGLRLAHRIVYDDLVFVRQPADRTHDILDGRGKDIDAACGQLANKNKAISMEDRRLKQ